MKTALFTLLALALPSLGLSQDDQAQTYTFKASAPVLLRNIFRVYYPTSPVPSDGSEYEGQWQAVILSTYATEGPFKVKSTGSVPFFTEPNLGSKKVAVAKLPRGEKELQLFFIGNKEQQRYACFSADSNKAPWGGYFVTNKSPHQLLIQVGKVKKIIKAGKSASITPGLGTHEVKIFTGSTKDPQAVRNTKWFTSESQREFVLYYGEKLRWVHIADNKQAETAQN